MENLEVMLLLNSNQRMILFVKKILYLKYWFNKSIGAYKRADGRRIDGRKVIVDYERGRTVQGWLPRRLGGGKGETRKKQEAGILKR